MYAFSRCLLSTLSLSLSVSHTHTHKHIRTQSGEKAGKALLNVMVYKGNITVMPPSKVAKKNLLTSTDPNGIVHM